MMLFLDCEFNGFGGELLSIALVPEAGDAFYRIVADANETPTDWVAENVLPILGSFRGAVTKATRASIRLHLQSYLMQFQSIHVIADWPEDIIHFCKLILTDVPGQRINTPPLTMEIVRLDSPSQLPHNALADAVGIRNAWAEHIATLTD